MPPLGAGQRCGASASVSLNEGSVCGVGEDRPEVAKCRENWRMTANGFLCGAMKIF